MIFKGTGLVKDDLYVTGFPWSPVYLLASEYPVLFEAGFYCMGRLYEQQIKEVLAEKSPETLFLTHVHYDHCGATPYLKKAFPNMEIAASRSASEIIKRPNAQKLMIDLSKNVIKLIDGMEGIDKNMLLRDTFVPFSVDTVLEDGQIIHLGRDLSIQVISTPGHTRDMLSYYIPEKKILIATEATGCLGKTGHIVTEFLIDYGLYISSLKRLAAMDIDILCQGHHFVFTDQDVKKHFRRSLGAAEDFKNVVETLLQLKNGSIDDVVFTIKSQEYDPNPGPKQPEQAYLINLRTRVAHLAKRLLDAKRGGEPIPND